MKEYKKSSKLDNVFYDIRGPVLQEAVRLQEEGYSIIRLNTGNPPAFDINAPDEIIRDVIMNIRSAEAYCDSKGLFPARKAIMQYCQLKNIEGVDVNDIYIGNGVSELIVMTMQGLLNNGDEVLIPMPDYPLWTGAANLAGGKAVHYHCDEQQDWYPDVDDIKKKITHKTKGIVVINPNNPTGSVYPKEVLQKIVDLAVEHQLIVFSDEIYDKILYEDAVHYSMAALSKETFFVTFNGLSKSHRVPGFRAGWMVLSGRKEIAKDYIEGLDMLSNMRLCSNVPAQLTIQTALGGHQSLTDLIKPGGRLREQRDYSYKLLNDIPGLSCTKPMGALYLFPKVDVKKFNITDDEQFALDFLREKKVHIVRGMGFNWPEPDHFRFIFLPPVEELKLVAERLADFLKDYRQ